MNKKWEALCALYCQEITTHSTAECKAFCENKDINYNSFRRELGKYKKLISDSDQPVVKKADQKVVKKRDQKKKTVSKAKPDQVKNAQKEPTKKKAPAPVKAKSQSVTRGIQQNEKTVKANALSRRSSTKVNNYSKDGKRCFKRNHQAGLIHGGHAKILFEDKVSQDFTHATMGDVIGLATARLMRMEVIRKSKVDAVRENYDNGKFHIREVMDDEGEIEKIPMTFEEAIFEAEYAGVDAYDKLFGRVSAAQEKLSKIQESQYNMRMNSTAETVEMTAQLLQHRITESLTAGETCELFYSNGVEPPKLLTKEAEIELTKEDETDIDGTGSVSEEQMEERRQVAKAKRLKEDAWKAQRIADNEKMLAELGDLGSEQVTESED